MLRNVSRDVLLFRRAQLRHCTRKLTQAMLTEARYADGQSKSAKGYETIDFLILFWGVLKRCSNSNGRTTLRDAQLSTRLSRRLTHQKGWATIRLQFGRPAEVAELADARDSKSRAPCGHEGSTPSFGTSAFKGLQQSRLTGFGQDFCNCARNCAHFSEIVRRL